MAWTLATTFRRIARLPAPAGPRLERWPQTTHVAPGPRRDPELQRSVVVLVLSTAFLCVLAWVVLLPGFRDSQPAQAANASVARSAEECARPVEERRGRWFCIASFTAARPTGAVRKAATPGGFCTAKGCWTVANDFRSTAYMSGSFGYGKKPIGTVYLSAKHQLNGAQMRSTSVSFNATVTLRELRHCRALATGEGHRVEALGSRLLFVIRQEAPQPRQCHPDLVQLRGLLRILVRVPKVRHLGCRRSRRMDAHGRRSRRRHSRERRSLREPGRAGSRCRRRGLPGMVALTLDLRGSALAGCDGGLTGSDLVRRSRLREL